MTLSLTATQDWGADDFLPRVRLDVTSGTGSPLPVPVNSFLQVFRIHPDGSRWLVIDEADRRLLAGSAVVFDYHCPAKVDVEYVAVAAGHESAAVDGFLDVAVPWLINGDDPEKSIPVEYVDDLGERSLPWGGQLVDIPGSPYPVPRSFGVRGAGGATLRFGVLPENAPAVELAVARSEPFLVNFPPQSGWDVSWVWVQPLDIAITNPGANSMPNGRAGYPYRLVSMPYVRIGQPGADLTPTWTDADLAAAYATDALVIAAFATDLGRTINVPGS